MMKFHILTSLAALLMLCSCGGSEQKTIVPINGSDDEIAAIAQAAAQRIVDCDRTDTLAIQEAIMAARAERSAFAIAGKEDGARTYDKALEEALRKLDPQLCDTIFATPQ